MHDCGVGLDCCHQPFSAKYHPASYMLSKLNGGGVATLLGSLGSFTFTSREAKLNTHNRCRRGGCTNVSSRTVIKDFRGVVCFRSTAAASVPTAVMVSGVKHLAVCVLVGIFAVTVQAEVRCFRVLRAYGCMEQERMC